VGRDEDYLDDEHRGGYSGYTNSITLSAARSTRFARPAIQDFLLPPLIGGPRLLLELFDVFSIT